jgi:hypothetical protein
VALTRAPSPPPGTAPDTRRIVDRASRIVSRRAQRPDRRLTDKVTS